MRIGLFGQFGSGNIGNDGSLEAMIQTLGRICPGAQLICICSRPELIEKTFGIKAISVGQPVPEHPLHRLINTVLFQLPRRITGFLAAVSLAQGIDVIVVPGTGILDDFNENPFGWPFAVFRWSVAAKLAGARFAFVSVGAGPVTHPLSRLFVRVATTIAAFRSYRDQVSSDFMNSLNARVAQDMVSADIAFGLEPFREQPHRTTGRWVGLGVMTYKGWKKQTADGDAIYDQYLSRMAELIDAFLADGTGVRLLTGDRGDLEAVGDIQRRIRSPHAGRIQFEPALSLHALMQQIAATDIVVASRYHNIVCSLLMNRPAISIGYAQKNDVLLNDTGLQRFCHHIENFDPLVVHAQAREMLLRREEFLIPMAAGVLRYRERLAEQEDVLQAGLLHANC
jgi:polysaccharide pyruvyl transferase WcaK-like protein